MKWKWLFVSLLGHILWDVATIVDTELATIHIQWLRSIGVFITLTILAARSPASLAVTERWIGFNTLLLGLLGFLLAPLLYTYGIHAASFRVAATLNIFIPIAVRWALYKKEWNQMHLGGYTLTCMGASVLWWGFGVERMELSMLWVAVALMSAHSLCIVAWYLVIGSLQGGRLRHMTLGAFLGALAMTLINNQFEWSETLVLFLAVTAGILGTSCKCYLMAQVDTPLEDLVLLECLHPFITYAADVALGVDKVNPHDVVGCLCILLGWLGTLIR